MGGHNHRQGRQSEVSALSTCAPTRMDVKFLGARMVCSVLAMLHPHNTRLPGLAQAGPRQGRSRPNMQVLAFRSQTPGRPPTFHKAPLGLEGLPGEVTPREQQSRAGAV